MQFGSLESGIQSGNLILGTLALQNTAPLGKPQAATRGEGKEADARRAAVGDVSKVAQPGDEHAIAAVSHCLEETRRVAVEALSKVVKPGNESAIAAV